MVTIWSGKWARAARRLVVSAFVVFHLGATVGWMMPACPLRARCVNAVWYYMLPLGLWQYWGMFCPDPPLNTIELNAEVIDVRGLRYNFAFPKQSDYSVWGAIVRARHPKFAINLASNEEEIVTNRVFAARHVVRQLGVPAEAFPVDVRLIFQVRACPPPGTAATDVLAPKQPYPIGTYRFANLGEVRP